MLFQVTGIYNGTSKTGNPFHVLHVVELERKQNGLIGAPVGTYYCTDEVAAQIIPGKLYDLTSEFGSRNVCGAKLVEAK